MLRFEHPEFLYGLGIVPVMIIAFFFLQRWRAALLRRFASSAMLRHLAPEVSAGKLWLKQTLFTLGVAFLIVTMANPQVGTRLEEIKREGIDLFVALDVSLSMKAEDIRPSRLEKAKRDVSALLQKLAGDRVGLIVFAGDAFIQFPLTSDYSAADLFISAVDVDAVPIPGTMIGSAIEKALSSFPMDAPTQKAIIIVSDGENTEGDIMGAVEQAGKAGVKVFTVGMGTAEGGPIPVYNGGQRVDYKRDRNGSIVVSRLDESMLQQIASATGGSYRRATSGGNEIDQIFSELSELEKVEFGVKQVTGYESQYQYPLAVALLLFLVEFLLSERRGTVLRWMRRFIPVPAGIVGLLLLMPFAGVAQTHRDLISEGNKAYEEQKWSDAEAGYKKALREYPDSREATFNLGNAYYRQNRYEEAGQSFGLSGRTGTDPVDRSRALYNLGNSFFKGNKIQESIEAYKQVLRMNPADDEARYNLRLAMEKLKQQQNQKNQQQQQQQQEQKDQQSQDQQQNQQQNQQDQQRQQEQQRNQQQQQQPQTAQKHQLPKDQADRILEALRNNEKEIQKQIRKREGVRIRTEKDW